MTEHPSRLYSADPPADEAAPVEEPERPPVGPQDPVSAWLAWHVAELTLIGGPLLAAVVWEWWVALLAVPCGALWAVNEVRQRTARPAQPVEGDDDDR